MPVIQKLIFILLLAVLSPLLWAENEPAVQESSPQFRSLDEKVQALKQEVIELNKDLFALEEELLFPDNTQVAVFVSMDVGTFFSLDAIQLKLDGKAVKNYLYTEKEVDAMFRGGVHRLHIGNLKQGKHELAAFFTGKGPHNRPYLRGTNLTFEKANDAKYIELIITDVTSKQQPEFHVKQW